MKAATPLCQILRVSSSPIGRHILRRDGPYPAAGHFERLDGIGVVNSNFLVWIDYSATPEAVDPFDGIAGLSPLARLNPWLVIDERNRI
jgi:hypothetical protein